jgi:hypothetical protein
LPAINTPEGKILALKYQGKRIGQMATEEISLWSKSLLLKIHVITGWVIPDSTLLEILIDQFQKKLTESYPEVTPDEVEYAFRNGGTSVKDWGKAMNLSLIDEVMLPYLTERKRLSHELEERSVPPPEQIIYTTEQLLNFHRHWTEEFYQRIRRGSVEKIPDYTRKILVTDGLIKNEIDAEQFLVNALNHSRENLYICAEPQPIGKQKLNQTI